MDDESRAIFEMGLTPGVGFVSGPKGLEAQRRALQLGQESSNRIIVNIVGRERQGKTSLRKLLTSDPFDPCEVSTVGMEQNLVATHGVNESWSALNILAANSNEFETVLGEHILMNLRPRKSTAGEKALASLKCFGKITIITVIFMVMHYTMQQFSTSDLFPYYTMVLMLTFGFSAWFFGVKDGYGIAIGINVLVVVLDGVYRWQLHQSFPYDIAHRVHDHCGLVISLVVSFILFAAMNSFIGLSCGASLGQGMTFGLCLHVPPRTVAMASAYPYLAPHPLIFMMCCLIGLLLQKHKQAKIVLVIPAMVFSLINVHEVEYLFTVMFGLGFGYGHGVFLALGQGLYIMVMSPLKPYLTGRTRRLFLYIVGLFPSVICARILQWTQPHNQLPFLLATIMFLLQIELTQVFSGSRPRDASPTCTTTTTSTAKTSTTTATTTNCSSADVLSPSKVFKAKAPRKDKLKLVLRDYAGHPLYYYAHHVFMANNSIYLLVFSLVDAARDYQKILKDLLYWLHSIRSHAHYPNGSIIVVATHRDHPSVDAKSLQSIKQSLSKDIPMTFHNMIIWNKDNSLVFPVENSKRSSNDADHEHLRSAILGVTKNAEFMQRKWPLRYLAFFSHIQEKRRSNTLLESIGNILEICQQTYCKIKDLDDLHELLTYFHSIGEIVYSTSGMPSKKDFVVYDPQFLVDLMAAVVTVPVMSERKSEFNEEWSRLEQHGLCTKDLIRHALGSTTSLKNSRNEDTIGYLLDLLDKYDLLCKMHLHQHITIPCQEYYLVPVLLPASHPVLDTTWTQTPNDTIFYIDFGDFKPLAVFLRLLCHCVRHDGTVDGISKSLIPNISRACGLFVFNHKHTYKLDIQEINCGAAQRELIKVTIRSSGFGGSQEVLVAIQERLKSIVSRDFHKCQYVIGPACPCSPPHDLYRPNTVSCITLILGLS